MSMLPVSLSDRELRRLLALGAPVGIEGRNRREDVARLELLLNLAGDHDLAPTEGPTGFFGQRLDQSIRRFQKRNDLAVDGAVAPGGETIKALHTTQAAEHDPRETEAYALSKFRPEIREQVARDPELLGKVSRDPELLEMVNEPPEEKLPAWLRKIFEKMTPEPEPLPPPSYYINDIRG